MLIDHGAAWLHHPDALIVARNEVVADVNPAAEHLFGHDRSWLVEKPIRVLLPGVDLRTATASRTAPLSRLPRGDGTQFTASVATSAMAVGRGEVLVVVRNLTEVLDWFDRALQEAVADGHDRHLALAELQRSIDGGRETLTQYLFGAGLILRSCIDRGVTPEERQQLNRAIDILDDLCQKLTFG